MYRQMYFNKFTVYIYKYMYMHACIYIYIHMHVYMHICNDWLVIYLNMNNQLGENILRKDL